MVASGIFDAYSEEDIFIWDVAAGLALVREAGGEITNIHGDTFVIGESTLVASNGYIHYTLIKNLNLS